MSRFARVVDGVVVETIDLPDGVTPAMAFPAPVAAQLVAAPPEVGQRWRCDAAAGFAPPAPPAPPPAPVSVTALQLRRALRRLERRAEVEAVLAALDEEEREEWEYAAELRRDGALVAKIAAGLGLKKAKLDALFRDAAAL